MMLIDMTAQLGSLITGLQVVLLIAAAAIGVSGWRRSTAVDGSSLLDTELARHLAIAGTSASVSATADSTPSDTSVREAA